jgi:hypothetical protein
LDCGKHISYDLKKMQLGKVIDPSRQRPKTQKDKGSASLPVTESLGAFFNRRKNS